MTRFTAQLALLCGVCMLIPLPWLDEYVERRVTRRIYAAIAAQRGLELDEGTLDVLTEDRSSSALGCLFAAIRWPLKKLFRTVLYFLTVKDVVDAVTRAAHRATLVEEAMERGLLPFHAKEVRDAMERVFLKYRVSPVSRSIWLQERPAHALSAEAGFEVRFVRWLQKHGAAGVFMPEYRAELEKIG